MQQDKKIETQELRVYIVDIVPPVFPQELIEDRLMELESLVTTYKWVVIVKAIQKRSTPDYRTYVGSGKLDEIKEDMIANNANLLIIWNIMKPGQVYNVSELFRKDKIQVWDRVDLILKIFERHATSTEARLQIELAAIKHMWPRIFGMGMELSRQWWGTGWSGWRAGRWQGETNTEVMRRHLKDKTLVLQKELNKYKKVRWLHRAWRVRKDLFTVGIVWYTNAGKSALMHALTGKEILVEDKLFATLWTAVGEMKPPSQTSRSLTDKGNDRSNYQNENGYQHFGKILVNDTVWFIRDLPPDLIDAFASTLEDSVYSQLVLHVIDAADPKISDKMHVVDTILHRIEAKQDRLYVFNKIDAITPKQRKQIAKDYEEYNPIFVSAITGEWLDDLKKAIVAKVKPS
jgi:GTPase